MAVIRRFFVLFHVLSPQSSVHPWSPFVGQSLLFDRSWIQAESSRGPLCEFVITWTRSSFTMLMRNRVLLARCTGKNEWVWTKDEQWRCKMQAIAFWCPLVSLEIQISQISRGNWRDRNKGDPCLYSSSFGKAKELFFEFAFDTFQWIFKRIK